MVDMVVGHSGDEIVRQPAMARLASFEHSGRVAAVEVRQAGRQASRLEQGGWGGTNAACLCLLLPPIHHLLPHHQAAWG